MKLLFDENLSPSLVQRLAVAYPGSTHVPDEGLRGHADIALWEYARTHSFAIASRDTNFRDLSFLHGAPPKVARPSPRPDNGTVDLCGREDDRLQLISRLPFEREVHALVAAVLLRRGGLDEVGQDAEADPPDREGGEPAGGEGDAVIRANPLRQAIGPEEALKDLPGLDQAGARERLTGQQEATAAIGHGERKAVLAIAELELPLVVGGPDRIGLIHCRDRRTGGPGATDAAAGGDELVVLEAASDGGAHGPRRVRPAPAH